MIFYEKNRGETDKPAALRLGWVVVYLSLCPYPRQNAPKRPYFRFFVLGCIFAFTPYYMYIGFKFFIHYYFSFYYMWKVVEKCVKVCNCKLLIFNTLHTRCTLIAHFYTLCPVFCVFAYLDSF